MKVNMTARKTTIKDQFRLRAEKKMAKFDRFFGDDAVATVTVTNERERETVEITISYRGMIYRAERTSMERLEALDLVVDALFRQIVKNKSRLEKNLRDTAFEGVAEPEMQPEENYAPVRIKHFPVKAMDVEEAILQMNMLGHEFFAFRNMDTDHINIVYKRKSGDFGLLVPENE